MVITEMDNTFWWIAVPHALPFTIAAASCTKCRNIYMSRRHRTLRAVKISQVNSYITTFGEVKKKNKPQICCNIFRLTVCISGHRQFASWAGGFFSPGCEITAKAVLLKRGPVCSRVRSEGKGCLASEGIHATQNNPSSWLPKKNWI